MGKLKFGVFLPFYSIQTKNASEQIQQIKTTVLECEKLGYDSVWLDDHLMYNSWFILETFTTLAFIAACTNTIRLGTMVSCAAHRNPALLAKTVATLDVLSNGRLDFGIGSGIQKDEHIAYGFSFPKAAIRTEKLDEFLEVVTRLWSEPKASFEGKYFELKDAICEPKPQQKPHPPIIVGGCGEKQTLKVTAKFADRFDWGAISTLDAYEHKLKILREYCNAINRDFNEIEKSCWPSGQILVAKNQEELMKKIWKIKPANMSVEEFKKIILAGTPRECSEQLRIYSDLGVTYFMLFFADLPNLDGLRLFREAMSHV